jgi:predicted amidohydrolase YtcJ
VGMLGESQHYVNLIDCESIKSLKKKVRETFLAEPELPFVVGFNWDQSKLGRLPEMADLEDLSIDKPVKVLLLYSSSYLIVSEICVSYRFFCGELVGILVWGIKRRSRLPGF